MPWWNYYIKVKCLSKMSKMSILKWMSAVECPTDNLMHKIKAIGKEDKKSYQPLKDCICIWISCLNRGWYQTELSTFERLHRGNFIDILSELGSEPGSLGPLCDHPWCCSTMVLSSPIEVHAFLIDCYVFLNGVFLLLTLQWLRQ